MSRRELKPRFNYQKTTGQVSASQIESGDISADRMSANVLAAINASSAVDKVDNAQLDDVAWDKVTKTGSDIADLETRTLFYTDDKAGADCDTGSDGSKGRELTLDNLGTDIGMEHVIVEGVELHSTQYSIVYGVSTTVVTFTNEIWDADKIKVVYGK